MDARYKCNFETFLTQQVQIVFRNESLNEILGNHL